MRDVDPLGPLVGIRTAAGDIGVVAFQERPPRDFDRLEAGVQGQLEASVQVVGGEHRARRHRAPMLSA